MKIIILRRQGQTQLIMTIPDAEIHFVNFEDEGALKMTAVSDAVFDETLAGLLAEQERRVKLKENTLNGEKV